MIKIESPFSLSELRPRFLGSGPRSTTFNQPQTRELLLQGVCISLEMAGRTFVLSTSHAPSNNGFRSSGLRWGRKVIPLTSRMSLEQQMLLANAGNIVALSWRLLGDALMPVSLKATPVFSASEPISNELFRFEPETSGGRLSWQPYHRAAKIIADTNGRCAASMSDEEFDPVFDAGENTAAPSTFSFDLGRRPALLLFSVESQSRAAMDPVLGGFLAELAEPSPTLNQREFLAAA